MIAAMRMVEKLARALPVVLPLALISPMLTAAPAQAEAVEAGDGEKDYDYGAKVKIELLMEDQSEVAHKGDILTLGTEWPFEFEGAEHNHQVNIFADGEEGKKNFDVTFSYYRDGEEVIAEFQDVYKAKQRQIVWNADQTIAIAITMTPYKFKREDKSRDDKDKIAPDDTENPLR